MSIYICICPLERFFFFLVWTESAFLRGPGPFFGGGGGEVFYIFFLAGVQKKVISPFLTPAETKISVLLSAPVERFGVSRMQNFFYSAPALRPGRVNVLMCLFVCGLSCPHIFSGLPLTSLFS